MPRTSTQLACQRGTAAAASATRLSSHSSLLILGSPTSANHERPIRH
uniref:Uncharacterized protein n=1 Tax=Arundo donax TaxID=35708 RepID=A0A0A9G5U7_ARUDO